MIDSYSFGKISINGKTYRSDVIIYPDRVSDSWWRKEGHKLHWLDIAVAILIIGQGSPGYMQVPESLRTDIRSRGIELFVSGTKDAVRKYNKTFESHKTVAALHLTC